MASLSHPVRRTLACLATGAIAVVVAPSTASAHVEGQEVEAGTQAVVPFHVGHGCDGAATTKIEIQVPPEATELRPVGVDGWEGTVEGQVVTFANGELPDGEELEFPVQFQAPSTPMTLHFPVIQTCGDVEVAWTSEDDEDEHPAPVVEVVAGEGGSTTTVASTGTTEPAGSATTVDEAATTSTIPPGTDPMGPEDVKDEDGDDSSPLVPILLGVAAVAVIGGGAYAYSRSKKGDGSGGDAGTEA